MNQFQRLGGPCLVCKRVKPGTAWGLTPELAVCDDDWVDNNDKAVEAITKAGQKVGLVAKSEAKEPRTIKDILVAVDDGTITAEQALIAEKAGEKRVSLIQELESRIKQ